MPLCSADDAHLHLDPLTPMLIGAHQAAAAFWTELGQDKPLMVAPLKPTARAGNLHDWVVAGVRAALVDRSDAVEASGLRFFAIKAGVPGCEILLRFKYLRGGRPSNVATDQQKLLAQQQYDDEMMETLFADGFAAEPTMLTCGYTLDVKSEISRVSIQCDYGRITLWRYVIWGDEAGSGFETLPLITDPAPTPARVTSKTPKRKDTAAGDQHETP